MDNGPVIGAVNAHYSKIFKVLQIETEIEYQAYVSQNIPRNIRTDHKRLKRGRTQLSQWYTEVYTLSVIWYGSMDKYEDIGRFFSNCSEYLQYPLRCNRNIPYRNPQSLSGKDEQPPMTLDEQTGLARSEYETLIENADPSAALQSDQTFPETEPPAAIRTHLHR